jgi:hypothetical protein
MGNCLLWTVTCKFEASHIFGLLYAMVTVMHKFWQKIGWDSFWGILFANSFGHPGSDRKVEGSIGT